MSLIHSVKMIILVKKVERFIFFDSTFIFITIQFLFQLKYIFSHFFNSYYAITIFIIIISLLTFQNLYKGVILFRIN